MRATFSDTVERGRETTGRYATSHGVDYGRGSVFHAPTSRLLVTWSAVDLSDREVRLDAGRIASECAEGAGVTVHAMLRGDGRNAIEARVRLCERLRGQGWPPTLIGKHFGIPVDVASAGPRVPPVAMVAAEAKVERAPRAKYVEMWPTRLAEPPKTVEEVRPVGENRGARARLALQHALRRTGHSVSLVTIHCWTRARQGEAYLWAVAFLEGREDLPAPQFVKNGGAS